MNLSQWNETLEETSEALIDAFKRHVYAKGELTAFEKNFRRHGYKELIGASNSQKMQLQFEHFLAVEHENWERWQQLINEVNTSEVELFSAQKRHDVNVELVRLVQSGGV